MALGSPLVSNVAEILGLKSGTWMSQEVSKWLVNGL